MWRSFVTVFSLAALFTVECHALAGGGGQNVVINSSYAYNQAGIRTRAESSTSVNGGAAQAQARVFLVDGQNHTGYAQVLEEAPATGAAPVRSYTIGDDVIGQTAGGAARFLMYDGHGSTRLLTNETGVVTDRFDYDAYGVGVGFTADSQTAAATDLLYTGEQFDRDLQQTYLRARYYNQAVGAFTSLDPFAGANQEPQSLHKYAYAGGDPVNSLDPSGRFSLIELVVVIAISVILFGGNQGTQYRLVLTISIARLGCGHGKTGASRCSRLLGRPLFPGKAGRAEAGG